MSNGKGGISFMVYGVSVLVALLIGAGGAGYVWFDGQQQLAAATDAHQADLDAAEAAAAQVQTQLDDARRKNAVLGARVEIARAHESLSQMNYGLVTKHLQTATQHLEGVEGAAPISGRISGTQVDPTNPEAAVAAVLSLAGELDTLLGK